MDIQVNHESVRAPARAAEGGSVTEALGGAAAIVLGILALIGLRPMLLGAIAAIAAGLGVLVAGAAIAGRYAHTFEVEGLTERREIVGGTGLEALTGVAAIVLGILALLGIAPLTLLAVSAIVLGAGLLMASGSLARLERLISSDALLGEHRLRHDTAYTATGSEVLIGIGAIVLGILALLGLAPLTLTLVALIAVGAVELFSGSVLASGFFSTFR